MNEPFVPLSRCALWRQHRAFFETEGIAAWNGRVPFYVTSNPYLAHAYAAVVVRFAQDRGEGVHVVELGAGSGAFSFQLLRRLEELATARPDLGAGLRYVMTDVSAKNLDFWRSHPALAPWVESGLLRFARFDLARDGLDALDLPAGAPLVVVANYVFDAVACDLFRAVPAEGGTVGVEEVRMAPDLVLPPNELANGTVLLGDILGETAALPAAADHYGHPALDDTLRESAAGYGAGRFLFPITPLRCLLRLHEEVARPLLVLVADKGFAHPAHTAEEGRLTLGRHGDSLSTSLDFDALSRFAGKCDGEAFVQSTEGILCAALTLGATLEELPETRLALAQFLGAFNPGHIYDVLHYFENTRPRARLESLVALLELTWWDPHVFHQFFDIILASLPYAAGYAIHKLLDNLPRLARNLYHLPGGPDISFQLGALLQELGYYGDALEHYRASLSRHGDTDLALYHAALCLHALGRSTEAVETFQRVLALTPNHIQARGWIAQIEHESRERQAPAREESLTAAAR